MKLCKMKKISRRDAVFMIGAFSTSMMLPISTSATTKMVSDRIKKITNGLGAEESDLFLDLPEIAENGNQVKVSFEIPEYTAQVDAIGTLRFLDAIKETRIKTKLYQASTSELYGKALSSPQKERTPFNPRSP